jgi:hypothetical protein
MKSSVNQFQAKSLDSNEAALNIGDTKLDPQAPGILEKEEIKRKTALRIGNALNRLFYKAIPYIQAMERYPYEPHLLVKLLTQIQTFILSKKELPDSKEATLIIPDITDFGHSGRQVFQCALTKEEWEQMTALRIELVISQLDSKLSLLFKTALDQPDRETRLDGVELLIKIGFVTERNIKFLTDGAERVVYHLSASLDYMRNTALLSGKNKQKNFDLLIESADENQLHAIHEALEVLSRNKNLPEDKQQEFYELIIKHHYSGEPAMNALSGMYFAGLLEGDQGKKNLKLLFENDARDICLALSYMKETALLSGKDNQKNFDLLIKSRDQVIHIAQGLHSLYENLSAKTTLPLDKQQGFYELMLRHSSFAEQLMRGLLALNSAGLLEGSEGEKNLTLLIAHAKNADHIADALYAKPAYKNPQEWYELVIKNVKYAGDMTDALRELRHAELFSKDNCELLIENAPYAGEIGALIACLKRNDLIDQDEFRNICLVRKNYIKELASAMTALQDRMPFSLYEKFAAHNYALLIQHKEHLPAINERFKMNKDSDNDTGQYWDRKMSQEKFEAIIKEVVYVKSVVNNFKFHSDKKTTTSDEKIENTGSAILQPNKLKL